MTAGSWGSLGLSKASRVSAPNPSRLLLSNGYTLRGAQSPFPSPGGSCFMNWTGLQRTGGRLTSLVCGAAARADGAYIKAVASLQAR